MNDDNAVPMDDNSTTCVNRQDRSSKLIMVVNDTQEILALFREILTDEGYDVVLSSYAPQELEEIQKVDPDLIILDLMIGGEAQGWQLLQKLRMTRATEKLPAIVCTAAVQLAKELEGHLAKKNVGLVLKPFDIDDLILAVHQALDLGESMIDTREPEPLVRR